MGAAASTTLPKKMIEILKFQDSRTSSELIRVLKKNEIFKQLAVRFRFSRILLSDVVFENDRRSFV